MQGRRKRKAAGEDVVGGEDDIFARFRRAIAGSQGTTVRGVDPTVNVAADNFDRLASGFGLSHLPTLVGLPPLPKSLGATTGVGMPGVGPGGFCSLETHFLQWPRGGRWGFLSQFHTA